MMSDSVQKASAAHSPVDSWPWILRWSYFRLLSALPDPVVTAGPPDARVVALTFDDGPSLPYTHEVLRVLGERGVRATFFLLGENVLMYPAVARDVVGAGHAFGAHTFSHSTRTGHNPLLFGPEVVRTHRLLSRVVGQRPRYFRPPRGTYTPLFFAGLRLLMGYRVIMWSVSAKDWRSDTAEAISGRVVSGVEPGGIVCLHDGSENTEDRATSDRSPTVAALPDIIDRLRSSGYRFVTIPELLALGEEGVARHG